MARTKAEEVQEEIESTIPEVSQEEIAPEFIQPESPQELESAEFILPEAGSKFSIHEGKFNPNEIKFLVYGESGVGKTRFASTWPDVCFLDIDKGMSSVKRQVFRFQIDYWEDLKQAIDFIGNGQHPFRTIVLDSLNELQSLSMKNVVASFTSIRRSYDSLPSQSDYGKMLFDWESIVRDLKALSLNVVYIAQVAPRVYETDPVQPQLIGKSSARNLARMMDIVGYLDKQESSSGIGAKQRIMIFDAVNYVTKDRSDVLPQRVEDPTYDSLFSHWKRLLEE